MPASRRKAAPMRAPSSLRFEMTLNDSNSSSSAASLASSEGSSSRAAQQKALLAAASQTHHSLPPVMFSSPALQSLIYATNNDRYPGAPGTLLHRAKVEAARALAASKREAQREAERRDEMKRLGILGVGKDRKRNGHSGDSSNGNGTGRSSRFNTPPGAERARRSAANGTTTTSAAAAANGNINGLPNGTSGNVSGSGVNGTSNGANATGQARGRANGRNMGNAIEHNSLPVPTSNGASQQQQTGQGSPSSPLLSSSGRLRRPATGSRGASPMPLTGPPGPRGGRSPVVAANLEFDEAAADANVVDPVVVPSG